MVGIRISFWGPAYLQGQTVSFKECKWSLTLGKYVTHIYFDLLVRWLEKLKKHSPW